MTEKSKKYLTGKYSINMLISRKNGGTILFKVCDAVSLGAAVEEALMLVVQDAENIDESESANIIIKPFL